MKYKTSGYYSIYYKWLIGDLDKPKKNKKNNE